MYKIRTNFLSTISCVQIVIFLLLPTLLMAKNRPIVFRKENSEVFFAITPEGNIFSTIPVEEDVGNFTITPGEGNIRIYKITNPDDNIVGITTESVKIRKQIHKDSETEPGTPSLCFNFTGLDHCEAYLENVDEYDFFIRGEIYNIDNIGPQPTYHREFFFQNEDDNDPIISTTYFDGFGRFIQNQKKQNFAFSQISGVYYDEAGRAHTKTKKASLANWNYFYTMYNDGEKKLEDAANDFFPEAGGKAFSENEYYYEPIGRLSALGLPGLEYSLEGNHSKIWYFGVTGSNQLEGLDQWFNEEGFLLPQVFEIPSWVEDIETVIQNIYNTDPELINYSLTVTKDPDGNYIQVLKDKFGREVRSWADSDKNGTNNLGEIITEYKYDIQGNLLETIPPKDRDGEGDPVKLISSTYRLYNSTNQIIRDDNPDKGITSIGYDAAGNVIQITKAVGSSDIEINYSYDAFDRIINIKVNSKDNIRIFYDRSNNISDLDPYLLTQEDVDILNIISTELENLNGNPVAELSIGYDPEVVNPVTYDKNRCIVDIYSYDEENRIKAKYKYVPGISWQKIEYNYNLQNKIIKKKIYPNYEQAGAPEPVVFEYNYDNLGRLEGLTDKTDINSDKKIYSCVYDDISRLQMKKYYRNNGSDIAKEVSYSYNIRDWLTKIDGGVQYTEEIDYTGGFIGNISHITNDYDIDGTNHSYDLSYTYDGINRLTSVEHDASGEPYSEAFRFDQVGRIKQKRKGENTLSGFSPEYQYQGFTNKLDYISDIQEENNYVYDDRGNMITDKSKKIDNIVLDWRDLPVRFTLQDGGSWRADVDIVYDASGNRVIKKDNLEENGTVTRAEAVAYVDRNMVFKNQNFEVEDYELEYFNLDDEGRKEFESNNNYYYVKNHLNSTNYVVNDEGNYIEASMYDSYGKMEQLAYSGEIDPVKEKFTGKEFDTEGAVDGITQGLGLYYFGARYYDPEIGRWIAPDNTQQFFDSYSYTGNRPIVYIDNDGDIAVLAIVGIIAGTAIVTGAVNAYIAHSKDKPALPAFGQGVVAGGLGAVVGVSAASGIGAIAGVSGLGSFGAFSVGLFGSTAGGGLGGFTGGFALGYLSTGDIGEGFQSGVQGLGWGTALGALGYLSATVFGLANPGVLGPNLIASMQAETEGLVGAAIALAINASQGEGGGGIGGGKGAGKGEGDNGVPSPPSTPTPGPSSTPQSEGNEDVSDISPPDAENAPNISETTKPADEGVPDFETPTKMDKRFREFAKKFREEIKKQKEKEKSKDKSEGKSPAVPPAPSD